jgi:hypothetical protein
MTRKPGREHSVFVPLGLTLNVFGETWDFFHFVDANDTSRNFAKRCHGFFVSAFDKRVASFLELAHATCSEHHHGESVGNSVETVLDGNTSHIPITS